MITDNPIVIELNDCRDITINDYPGPVRRCVYTMNGLPMRYANILGATWNAGQPRLFKFIAPNGESFDCLAYVTRYSTTLHHVSATFSVTSFGEFNPPLHRKEQPKMAKKIRNKFYVAHPKVHLEAEQADVAPPAESAKPKRWARASLKDAIDHANLILEAQPDTESVAIVEIVRVVRRRKLPPVVEKV